LNSSLDDRDLGKARETLHILKGICGTVGASYLENHVKELEAKMLVINGLKKLPDIAELSGEFDRVMMELNSRLPELYKISGIRGKSNYSHDEFLKDLARLNQLLSNFDMESQDLISIMVEAVTDIKWKPLLEKYGIMQIALLLRRHLKFSSN
jgi:HPt (histidine-containing phosphotransfer) domain-containing protein